MLILLGLVSAYILTVLQLSISPVISLYHLEPNLIVIAIVVTLAFKRPQFGEIIAGATGLFIDLFSPFRFGVYILLYIGIYFFLRRFSQKFVQEINIVSWLGLVGLAALIAELPTLFITLNPLIWVGNVAYTLAVSIFVFGLTRFTKTRQYITV